MKEKKIARDTRNREKLAGDDWVMGCLARRFHVLATPAGNAH